MRTGEEVRTSERKSGGGIVCAGNFIVDRVHTLSYWPEQGNLAHIVHQDVGVGGGAANVVTDLSSLGFPARLAAAGCIGADIDGEIVKTRLQGAGVDVGGLQALSDRATAHTHVMNVPGQNRTFFYHGGANDAVTDALVTPATFAGSGYRLFYLGYLMLLPGLDALDADGRSGASRLLEAARNAGLTTCVDFVSSEDTEFAAKVGAALPYCDFIVINEIEAGRATGITVRGVEGELDEAALLAAGERLLVAPRKSASGLRRGAHRLSPVLDRSIRQRSSAPWARATHSVPPCSTVCMRIGPSSVSAPLLMPPPHVVLVERPRRMVFPTWLCFSRM